MGCRVPQCNPAAAARLRLISTRRGTETYAVLVTPAPGAIGCTEAQGLPRYRVLSNSC